MSNISRNDSIASDSRGGSFGSRFTLSRKLSFKFRKSNTPANKNQPAAPIQDTGYHRNSNKLGANNLEMNHNNSKRPFRIPDFFRRSRAKSTGSSPFLHNPNNRVNIIPQISIEAPRNDVACQLSSQKTFSEIGTQTSQADSPSIRSRCNSRRNSSLTHQMRIKQLSNSDSEAEIEVESKDESVVSENDNQAIASAPAPALPSIIVTDNNEKYLGIRRKISSYWRRMSLEYSSDDSRRGSLSPNISRRNSATNAESVTSGAARNFAYGRKASEGPLMDKWFPSLLQRMTNTASADWLPISTSKSVPEHSDQSDFSSALRGCTIEIIVEDTEMGVTVPVVIDDEQSSEDLDCTCCTSKYSQNCPNPQCQFYYSHYQQIDIAPTLADPETFEDSLDLVFARSPGSITESISIPGPSERRESGSMEIMQGFRARKCSMLQVPQPHLDERVVSLWLRERLPSKLPPSTTVVEDLPCEPPPSSALNQRRRATAGLSQAPKVDSDLEDKMDSLTNTPAMVRRFALTKQTSTTTKSTTSPQDTPEASGSPPTYNNSPSNSTVMCSTVKCSRPKLSQLRGNNRDPDDISSPAEPPPFFSDKIDPERCEDVPRGSEGHEFAEGSALVLGIGQQEIDPAEVTLADIQSRSYLYWNDTDSIGEAAAYENKKQKTPISWNIFKSGKKQTSEQAEFQLTLDTLKVVPIDHHLIHLRDKTWPEVIADVNPRAARNSSQSSVGEDEKKRRDVVWELFTAELNYLVDHLLVMSNVFLEPLKESQCEGFLLNMEPVKIFANLEDLCKVTSVFCSEMHHYIFRAPPIFGSAYGISKVFHKFEHQICPSYQRYCMNYSNALSYMEHQLRGNVPWEMFVRHCERDSRCKRLKLTDLLVAPMQHLTKYPLLLKTIRKKTFDHRERKLLQDAISNVEAAIKSVEGQVKWLKNFERLQELSKQIQWFSVLEQEPRPHLPESLRQRIREGSMERIIASPLRNLRYEGQLSMLENTKHIPAYLFLFDDMLLVTKLRKVKKGSYSDDDPPLSASSSDPFHRRSIGGKYANRYMEQPLFVVIKQPIPLDRLEVHPVDKQAASSSGLKNAFVLVHISRFQQIIALCLLQAKDDSLKSAWIKQLKEAKLNWEGLLNQKQAYQDSQKQSTQPQQQASATIISATNNTNNNSILDSQSASSQIPRPSIVHEMTADAVSAFVTSSSMT
ncbi:uncharacterized protein LOC134855924 isoform X2 [Symsagittifera roscoffensis]|uniref:uncharacterized protein LOC134855924 isoform X2 n=1 Tax=Symsagittifera roscoffensis TaxID=84072 RepID=UPI00307B60EF